MKITNYEIYKLKKSGLTNQQILKVLEYGESVDQGFLINLNQGFRGIFSHRTQASFPIPLLR